MYDSSPIQIKVLLLARLLKLAIIQIHYSNRHNTVSGDIWYGLYNVI